MTANEHSLGYKRTKAGWIPDGWECVRLGEVFTQRSARGAEAVPVFSVSQKHGLVLRDALERRVETRLLSRDSLLVEPGDIAYNMMRMWQGAVDVCREACVVSPAYVVVRPNHNRVDAHFMLRYFKSPTGLGRLRSYSYGVVNDRLRLYFKDFALVPSPLPTLPEQEAIAEVLDCWDRAIRAVERKLEKKRAITKGLAQQLLSGERRLPGFEGEWEEVQFGEVFKFLKTYAYSRAQLTTDAREGIAVSNIHYGDLHATYSSALLDCATEARIPRLRSEVNLPKGPDFLRDGDLIIADASEDYEGVGTSVELANVGNQSITGGLHTFAARPDGNRVARGYAGLALREAGVANQLRQVATGVSVHGISKTNLVKVSMRLPAISEQREIAVVITRCSAEVSALDRKLSLLREQKRYLLNNLVTGAIRLPQFRDHGKHGSTRKGEG